MNVQRLGSIVILLLVALASHGQPGATLPAAGFSGTWRTTFGVMTLEQKGETVTGSYASAGLTGAITGKVVGNTLTFTYKEAAAAGEGVFELAADRKTFSGRWRVRGDEEWSKWDGQRLDAAIAATPGTFDGVWNTSFGSMRLYQKDRTVRGIYSWAGRSTLSGEIDEKGVLSFTYEQPDGEKGQGSFTLGGTNVSFTGTWRGEKGGAGSGGSWSGVRVPARPNVVWLVVLEAPWEQQLRDHEFSYGQMLRAYFARIPTVQVRHRSIADEADVRRWCAEVPYLPEPVVLYFSSHGTKEGLLLGNKVVGADVLVDCIRDATNVTLLHFGSCLICSGDVPKKLHTGLGGKNAFPISGFQHPADWAGSALVDFAYLELMFAHGMTPTKAAEQVRKMMTFATDKTVPGTAIPAAGLVVVEPPK